VSDLFPSDLPAFSQIVGHQPYVISAISRFTAANFCMDVLDFSVLSFYYGS
jgi:hypothetical protein